MLARLVGKTGEERAVSYRVGVDIGGTFTDVVLVDDEDRLRVAKVPTTPGRFTEGLMHGVRRLDQDPAAMALFSHGTTVATNAVVERRGARSALVTTAGFRDTLLLRRHDRAKQFDIWWQPEEPLIPRRHIFEVPERMDFRGQVVTPLDEDSAREVARTIRDLELEAVAVVFLHSFMQPDHEVRMREILLEEHPDAYVTISSQILPEILEYERTSTVAINAYVGPVMSRYFARLASDLADFGYDGDILISSSAGGVMTPDIASLVPAKTMASGPSAGVIASAEIAGRAGYTSVITFDMGGTSLDLGLVDRGAIRRTNEWFASEQTPVRFPAIDVTSIGAGGGSIAWVDRGGVLHSGPQSASAEPGPACYGRGGTEPTNTDAQVVLGRLDPDRFLGGEMAIDPGLARAAVLRRVGEPLGLDSAEEAAEAILRISNNNMTQATRLTTVFRGYDPRDFALFAFGGAGPLFAAEIARESDIPTVIVPPLPGLASASGLLMMDVKHELSQSVLRPVDDLSDEALEDVVQALEAEVREALAREGVGDERLEVVVEGDVRYFGMSQSVAIALERGPGLLERMQAAFEEVHTREYGYTVPPEVAPVELATIRVAGVGSVAKAQPDAVAVLPGAGAAARATRRVFFDGEWQDTAILARERLRPGDAIEGPAIVEQTDSTTVIHPGMSARVDAHRNIIIDVRPAEREDREA
jgi:N-methylhydantoinase A